MKKRIVKNKEAAAKRQRAWYLANAERLKEKARLRNTLKKESIKAQRAAKYKENAETVKAKAAAYRAENKEKIAAYWDGLKKNKPELVKEYKRRASHVRRARLSGGNLSFGLFDRLIKLQRNKCAVCRESLDLVKQHLDHIVPLAAGGLNVDDNVQILCQSCNCRKGKKDPIKFMQERGFLC